MEQGSCPNFAIAENIERFPRVYAVAEDAPQGLEIRHAILERFEVRVIYHIRRDEAMIVAAWVARRRPGTWHFRVT